MIVIGIDPGLTRENPCGLAILDTAQIQLIHSAVITPPARAAWDDALFHVCRTLDAVLSAHPYIELLCYELPHLGAPANAQTLLKLAHVGGAVCAFAARLGVPVIGVQPTQAKIALTGHSKAVKVEMVVKAHQLFGRWLAKDAADACGVALAGEALWRRGQLARMA